MANGNHAKLSFSPTLFDRLFDDNPSAEAEYTLPRLSLEELKDSVARDLEALLNSRSGLSEEKLKPFPASANSVLSFGMTDFVGRSLANPADRNFICASLEQAIAAHEPRLRDVRVGLDLEANSINSLHFSISALLVVHPAQEAVSFDALLQPTTQQYSISQARRGAAR